MTILTQDSLARLVLTTDYRSDGVCHTDHYYCGSVNLWRDFFRPDHLELLLGLRLGDCRVLVDGESISYDPSWRLRLRLSQWRQNSQLAQAVAPRVGRWYPQGFLSGVSGIYPQSTQPMRIIAVDGDHLEVDCNHPLADIPLRVQARVEAITSQARERGGRCTDWLDDALADGPGMQLVRNEMVDFGETDRFQRQDDSQDQHFYRQPRLVEHLDGQARAHLLACATGLLEPGAHVLDLMSSKQSHLPSHLTVTGLGMNPEELQANERLSQWLVRDLNENPILPFADRTFDAVCCHLSIEYLTRPMEVIGQVARVLRPGGQVLISFSDRWFPEKVTRIWQKLHAFERLRYVLEFLRADFSCLATITFRNWPRPADDPHYPETQLSDPLFLVTGRIC